jgi:hypothetical protein
VESDEFLLKASAICRAQEAVVALVSREMFVATGLHLETDLVIAGGADLNCAQSRTCRPER